MFLFFAAAANALKQMAMLTSSSTRYASYFTVLNRLIIISILFRTAIYRAFSRNADNIGDITAKGEAQIAVIDLIGMFAGIFISKRTSTSRANMLAMFTLFTFLDLFCIFNEIKSVVFDSLNFERAGLVLNHLLNSYDLNTQNSDIEKMLKPNQVARTVSACECHMQLKN